MARVSVDAALVDEAMRATGIKTKRAVARHALKLMIEIEDREKLRRSRGASPGEQASG